MLEPSAKVAKFHPNTALKPLCVSQFGESPLSAAFRCFLSPVKPAHQTLKAPPSAPSLNFHLFPYRNAHASVSASHVARPNSECVSINHPNPLKILPELHGKGSGPVSLLFLFTGSDRSRFLEQPRANSKAHHHVFGTSAIYPAKRTQGTSSKCKNRREDAEKKPKVRKQELAQVSPVQTGELSAFEGRQQLAQAASEGRVPPWQRLPQSQGQACFADSEKSHFLQSPLARSLRGGCAEVKNWGYN